MPAGMLTTKLLAGALLAAVAGLTTCPGRETIFAFSAGDDHNCEVYTWDRRYYGRYHRVHCWGNHSAGQLANFENLNTALVETVAAGGAHTCWRRGNGNVGCQGDDTYGQSTVPAAASGDADESAYIFTAITAGKNHTCAIEGVKGNSVQTVGSARCWGSNLQGQSSPPADSDFIAITAGAYHTCGLKSDGTVRCWGDNSYGQAPGVR